MCLDDPVEILFIYGFSIGRCGGDGSKRGRAGSLHAGVSICFVVVADVQEVLSSFQGSGECLDTDVCSPAVSGIDDDVGHFAFCPESFAHSGSTGGGGRKCDVIDGHRVEHVGVDPLDHTVTTGGYHEDGVFACGFENIAECK